jgi:hypothetical protein
MIVADFEEVVLVDALEVLAEEEDLEEIGGDLETEEA